MGRKPLRNVFSISQAPFRKTKGGNAFIVRHPAARAVFGKAKGQRHFTIAAHGGENNAYDRAQRHLKERKQQFQAMAEHREQATLCLCLHRPCPHAHVSKTADGARNTLHCPGYRIVERTSIEHRLSAVVGNAVANVEGTAPCSESASLQGCSSPAHRLGHRGSGGVYALEI